ncbi:hypothetical protein L916_13761 [Phytophthora nicotianae]|uniref:Reverse transcriptase domain-containing protein n=1 Tax=Phytophthora nicotianae TaxID=4792 RepID=W2IIA7_PHYNI|nr:hypothetical protein L916_13761 [Phytophthora nicotianae]
MPDPDVVSEAIDTNQVGFLSTLAHHSQLSLPNFIHLLRNQSASDARPNKELFELPVPPDSERAHSNYKTHKPQLHRPAHCQYSEAHTDRSTRRHHESVLKLWPEVFISPIGIAEKGDNDTRLINVYSYPRGCSVNDFTNDGNFSSISYNPPGDIARRIHKLRTEHPNAEVLLMLGDVSSAFRQVPIHEDAVHIFAFIFDGYVVIDLSCGFGWGGSPAFYSLFGAVINDLYEPRGPTNSSVDSSSFVGNVWCNDHTFIGPSAINDEAFMEWSQVNKALELVWNTSEGTVSIPLCKLQKTECRVHKLLEDGRSTRRDFNSVLGVMRHTTSGGSVLSLLETTASMVYRWPQFANIAEPDIHVYTDACDDGLCALDPSRREFIRLKFSPDESHASSNSITRRELQSAVLPALVWGLLLPPSSDCCIGHSTSANRDIVYCGAVPISFYFGDLNA